MSNLDKLLKEMEEKSLCDKDDNKPMPEIKVGDLLFVENLYLRNLALVVAEVDNELIIYFPLRIGDFGIPLSKVKDDVKSVVRYVKETTQMDCVWMKNENTEFEKVCKEALKAIFEELHK